MKKKAKKLLILLTALSVLACSSCAAPSLEERPELYTGEYFQDTTPSEHWYYIMDTFITLLPHLQTPEELGVGSIQYSFGYNLATHPNPDGLGKLESHGTSNGMGLKSIPVFYGLLKETQKYEEQMGIDNSEIAEKHGKKHAVSAKSVEDYYYMLLRHAGQLDHGSTDGAEYVDGYYVYDELINPYQEWLDKGWELDIIPDLVVEDNIASGIDEWGKVNFGDIYCIALWYDKEGNIYNVFGELFGTQEDPSHRLTQSEYLTMRNNNSLGGIVCESFIHLTVLPENGPIQLNTEVNSIGFGTNAGSNQAG